MQMIGHRRDRSTRMATGLSGIALLAAGLAVGCAHPVPVGFPDEAPAAPPRACAATVAARVDTLATTLYATTGYNPKAAPDISRYRDESARRLLSFMRPLELATDPMLDKAPIAVDTGPARIVSGPVLDADLVVVLDRTGRIASTRFARAPQIPELARALMDAVRRADSAQAISAPPEQLPGTTAELAIRLFGTGSRLPAPIDTAAPVFTIAEPRFVVKTVDVPARALPGGWAQYPRGLRDAGVQGIVELQFIVGADGRVDGSSVTVVFESDPEFTVAVRRAIPEMRFDPARIGNCATRSWARQRFEFRLGGRGH
jgi:TonB family protein